MYMVLPTGSSLLPSIRILSFPSQTTWFLPPMPLSQMSTVADHLSYFQPVRAAGSSPFILTDDKAPVELLGMEVIDILIDEEIGYYKDIFREEGLSGLIEAL